MSPQGFTQGPYDGWVPDLAAAAGWDPEHGTIDPRLLTEPPDTLDMDVQNSSASIYCLAETNEQHAHSSAQRSVAPSPTAGPPYVCGIEGCTKSYSRHGDLEKHRRNHLRPRKCDICGHGAAENKDLNRHMWVHHPNEARERGVPREESSCLSCHYSGRRDNVKRHRQALNH
ncbi:hypothetical protein VTH06DRAFT_6245 [Thermothelomyces fergusii]